MIFTPYPPLPLRVAQTKVKFWRRDLVIKLFHGSKNSKFNPFSGKIIEDIAMTGARLIILIRCLSPTMVR